VGRVLTLPTGTAVDESIIARVCGILRAAVEDAPRVRRALAAGSDGG
jgi:hypothetical protein